MAVGRRTARAAAIAAAVVAACTGGAAGAMRAGAQASDPGSFVVCTTTAGCAQPAVLHAGTGPVDLGFQFTANARGSAALSITIPTDPPGLPAPQTGAPGQPGNVVSGLFTDTCKTFNLAVSERTISVSYGCGQGGSFQLLYQQVTVPGRVAAVVFPATFTTSLGTPTPAPQAALAPPELDVIAAAPAQLSFVQQPGGATEGRAGRVTAGQAMSPAVAVQVEDRFGNPTAGSEATVDLALRSPSGQGRLSGSTSNGVVEGLARFDDLVVDRAEPGDRLVAGARGLRGTASFPFDVIPGPPARLAFTTQPGGARAGEAFSTQPVVEVRDAEGNLVIAGQVALAVAGGGGAAGARLSCSGGLSREVSQGMAAFDGCALDSGGNGYRLVARSGDASATSNPFDVLAAPPATSTAWVGPAAAGGGGLLLLVVVVVLLARSYLARRRPPPRPHSVDARVRPGVDLVHVDERRSAGTHSYRLAVHAGTAASSIEEEPG